MIDHRALITLFCILFCWCGTATAQSPKPWIRHNDSSAIFFADSSGTIKWLLHHDEQTNADTLYHMVAVERWNDTSVLHYYRHRDGRIIGSDSVYLIDFEMPCECEGMMRFYSRQQQRIGYFDSTGSVAIPAIYNYITPFYNGKALALRNAIKSCWDKQEDTLQCEHWSWEKGEWIIINAQHEILARQVNASFDDAD